MNISNYPAQRKITDENGHEKGVVGTVDHIVICHHMPSVWHAPAFPQPNMQYLHPTLVDLSGYHQQSTQNLVYQNSTQFSLFNPQPGNPITQFMVNNPTTALADQIAQLTAQGICSYDRDEILFSSI